MTYFHSDDVSNGIIRKKELQQLLQIGRTTLWRWEKNQPDFPKRIKFGRRAVGYLRSEVNTWLASRERVDGGEGGAS